MPALLCFEENYEETARCLEIIRENLREGEEKQKEGKKYYRTIPHYADFATVRKCSPSAALVIAAEFDKSRALREWDIPLVDIHRWHRSFRNMLDELGFFRLLKIHRPPRYRLSSAAEIMQFQTGSMVAREEVTAITDKMIDLLTNEVPTLQGDDQFQITLMQLLGAVQEATENSCDHAYRNSVVPDVNRRWWATGAIDPRNRHINVIVYDQGNTIPQMLPTWEKYPFIASRLARFTRLMKKAFGEDELDAIKMRLAMDAPRSSTEKPHRGKGFVLFRDVVEQSTTARLKIRILSRHGQFVYQTGARPQTTSLKMPLRGTLVEWDLWVS